MLSLPLKRVFALFQLPSYRYAFEAKELAQAVGQKALIAFGQIGVVEPERESRRAALDLRHIT